MENPRRSPDVSIHDFPKEAKSVHDISQDFQPGPIGRRSQIIPQILEVVPLANFTDPACGRIEGPDFSVEVNLGKENELRCLALNVRGDNHIAVGIVAEILKHLDLRAISVPPGDFFDPETADEAFRCWRVYRDQIVVKP